MRVTFAYLLLLVGMEKKRPRKILTTSASELMSANLDFPSFILCNKILYQQEKARGSPGLCFQNGSEVLINNFFSELKGFHGARQHLCLVIKSEGECRERQDSEPNCS